MTSVTKSSCSIGWKKPRSDGGSRITGYVVDFLTEENKWQRVMKSLSLQYTTKDLTEGKEYTFRVSAENENGEGTPSEITAVAKDDVGKPLAIISISPLSSKVHSWDFPGSPVIKTSPSNTWGSQVRSLVWELRSYMLNGQKTKA